MLGITSLERHITLDRTMYGSDQAASLELSRNEKSSESIDKILLSLGEPSLGKIIDDEIPIAKKLRAHIKIIKVMSKIEIELQDQLEENINIHQDILKMSKI